MGLGPVGEAACRAARDCGDVACRLGVVRLQGGAELLDDGVRQLFGHAVGHHLREHVGRIGFGVAQVAAQHLAEDCDLVSGAERFGAGELVDPVVVAVMGEAGRGDRCDVRRVDDRGSASGERGVHDLIGRDHSAPS